MDVFCPNWQGASKLFRNDGTGRFVSVTNVVFNQNSIVAGAWGDYDNDGRVDLCAASWGGTSFVYRNLGDGEFERAAIGQNIGGSYFSACWADYDNDGFLDLYLFNSDANAAATAANFLYHNNGNANAWITVRLIGTASNRDAVGAKVRVQARYAGQVRWQRRDITGGDVLNGNQLDAHFGLGNATNVTTLRIEWPSGTVQELPNVATNQFLTIWEPPAMSAAVRADGACELSIKAEPNRAWQIKASSDLLTWQTLTTVTNTTYGFQSAALGEGMAQRRGEDTRALPSPTTCGRTARFRSGPSELGGTPRPEVGVEVTRL